MSPLVPIPVRPASGPCVRCERPIRPGELYAVLDKGPMHFGCHPAATANTVAGTQFEKRAA